MYTYERYAALATQESTTGLSNLTWSICTMSESELPKARTLPGVPGLLLRNSKKSYYIGETSLFSTYTHYGNLMQGP